MIERRKIIKSQSSPPVQKFSKRKERVGELNVSNASRATHRKPNNANHRRSLSLSLSLSNARARERERELSLPRSAVKQKDRRTKRERKRERSLEKSARTERESPRSLSLSNVSISSGATRRNFLSQTARARARTFKKKRQNAHLCD
jgi:hypothetical protein